MAETAVVRSPRLAAAAAEPAAQSELAIVWRRFRRHRLAMLGLVVLGAMTLISLLAPVLAPYDPFYIDRTITGRAAAIGFTPPSATHPLGTDELRRDILSRLMYAGRVSLAVGFGAMLVSVLVGTVIGAFAGYYGGWVDSLLMRLVDLFLSFPFLPLLIVISAMIKNYQIPGDQTMVQIGTIIVVLTSLGWMVPARLVRGQFLSLVQRDFVTAARALGAPSRRIILRHLLPNSLAPLIVYATLAVGEYIIIESALSFLGLGISPPTPSWGNMLSAFQTYMRVMPIVAIYPGACIFLTVISINFLGDGLRDALDPWLRHR